MSKIQLLLMALLCFAAVNSFAHSRLVESVPTDGSELESSPTSATLAFSAPVRIVKLALTDSRGSAVEIDLPDNRGPAAGFEIVLPVLPAGEYALDWTVMGQDTHRVSGTLRFVVGPGKSSAP